MVPKYYATLSPYNQPNPDSLTGLTFAHPLSPLTTLKLPVKYVVYKKRLNWKEAETTCRDMRMELAEILSEEDNVELQAEANRNLGSPYRDTNFENVNKVNKVNKLGSAHALIQA